MKQSYVKPAFEIIRLDIEEDIASKVPKTIYKRNAATGTFTDAQMLAVALAEEGVSSAGQ